MKIRFIQTCSTARTCYIAGRSVELPPAEARQYIDAGQAEEIAPALQPREKTPAADDQDLAPSAPPAATPAPAVERRRQQRGGNRG